MLLNCGVGEDSFPWTARSNQAVVKEISPEYSLEGLMLKLKLQYFGQPMWRTDSLEKSLMLGKTEGRRRGWQRMRWLRGHRLDGHEFEQAPGVGEGQRSLVCCSLWGRKELDTTERLNNKLCDSIIEPLRFILDFFFFENKFLERQFCVSYHHCLFWPGFMESKCSFSLKQSNEALRDVKNWLPL